VLSSADIARIKEDIAKLEKARDNCADTGIRSLIEAWIEAEKKKLAQ
jgi:hypothetical protein